MLRGSNHISSDWYIVGPVDEHYQSMAPGVTSHTAGVSEYRNPETPAPHQNSGPNSLDLLQRSTDTFGVRCCPAVGRCDRHPTGELSVP